MDWDEHVWVGGQRGGMGRGGGGGMGEGGGVMGSTTILPTPTLS